MGRGDRRRDRPPRRALRVRFSALCLLPDGRLASGSWDNTIRLWDVATGAETARLEGHYGLGSARCACCRTGGSPRAPGTTRSGCGTWRPAPRPPASKGTRVRFSALCLLPDGRLASGSWDNTIRLWDVATGAETARLEGHSSAVQRAVPAAGRAARLGLLGQHDPAVGRGDRRRDRPPRRAFESGRRAVPAAGRAARLGLLRTTRSGCGTWRPAPRPPASRGTRVGSRRCACCRTGGSPRAPGTTRSGCGTWRPAPRPPASRGIRVRFTALCLLPDGRLASGSWDNTIRLWDVATGAETARLEGHYGFGSTRSACCRTGGSPRALRTTRSGCGMWRRGAETARLEGHSECGSAPSACCRTGGSPRAPGTTRSGCGTWRPGPRPPASKSTLPSPRSSLIAPNRLVAGDSVGRLHWLEVLD